MESLVREYFVQPIAAAPESRRSSVASIDNGPMFLQSKDSSSTELTTSRTLSDDEDGAPIFANRQSSSTKIIRDENRVLYLPIADLAVNVHAPPVQTHQKPMLSPRKPLIRTRSMSPTDLRPNATPMDILKRRYKNQIPSTHSLDESL